MADLNLNQIQNRLNERFVTYGERKLIFWFDPKKEFEEDIASNAIILDNAKIVQLQPNTQFLTKRFFELEDTVNSYLIYAPFEKMKDNDPNNHLLSILKYSSIFNADRISLIMTQLNIPNDLHETMEKYTKFFGARLRVTAFEKMMPQNTMNKEIIEMTIMAVATKATAAQFPSIVQSLFVEYSRGEDELYRLLDNYELTNVFWEYVSKYYGYLPGMPSIQKLIISFFANTFFAQIGQAQMPASLKQYEVLEQRTAMLSLMDSWMNDSRYVVGFDILSKEIYQLMGGNVLLEKVKVEDLVNVDVFEESHQKVLNYFVEQLIGGDITPTLGGVAFSEIALKRERSHFGSKFKHQYQAILNAQNLLKFRMNFGAKSLPDLLKLYTQDGYKSDMFYRKFIWHLDKFEVNDNFISLQSLVEKTYKTFLDEISQLWNENLNLKEVPSILDFYEKVALNNMKTVIIISDAFRYEAAIEMQEILQAQKKYSTTMKSMLSVLPSVTEFGKAASLRGRNETISYLAGTEIKVNDMPTSGTVNRDKILRSKNQNSIAVTYEEAVAKESAKELREMFNGKEIIYLYHDQVDRTGDHGQESQVFDAVEKAIHELKVLIPRISNGANIYRFIVTSDHGFIYTRSKVEEHEKIDNPSVDKQDRVERRFIISHHNYAALGIQRLGLGEALRNDDERIVYFPKTSAIFKKVGGGQNYVHGGSSPQEMVIPVLEIEIARGKSTKEQVQLQVMTTRRKIVGLTTSIEFYQTEAVGDTVSKGKFSIYFENKNGEALTKENIYYADSVSDTAGDRMKTFVFEFINRRYDANEKIDLVVRNTETGIEVSRVEFIIDNPFAGDFGFDF